MEINGNGQNGFKFYCKSCDYGTSRSDVFSNHLLTRKHINFHGATTWRPENMDGNKNKQHICEKCNYVTSRLNDFNRHLLSLSHVSAEKHGCCAEKHGDSDDMSSKICAEKHGDRQITYSCENCKREFQTNAGLWKHKKACTLSAEKSDILKSMMDQQKQMFDFFQQNNMEIRNIIVDLCKNTNNIFQQNTMIHNNVQQNNNTFNLNLFLNETCKDAMNLSDFIKGVKVSIDDIEHIGKVGYVDGLSDLIIKNLNELGVERRPIHCTDAKRQIVYVKEDDKWEKEDDAMTRLKKMVCGVQHANFVTLKKWREMYPSCLTATSIYTDTYNTMSQELMGGDCEKISLAAKELKIISKIAKGMTIDKAALVLK